MSMNRLIYRRRLDWLALAFVVAMLLSGCQPSFSGPEVLYSYRATQPGQGRPQVYVAAVSGTQSDDPVAITVLDPLTDQPLDTFPLREDATGPCGARSGSGYSYPVRYGTLDDRYIPFARWEEAATGRGAPYRIRIYFRSNGGIIWETEVSARYAGC